MRPVLVADGIRILNSANCELYLNINYNPESGSKTFNVALAGQGPICRLDVDGPPHAPAGRTHKHAVRDENSIRQKLRNGVRDLPELSGRSVRDLFRWFCDAANIEHVGELEAPDEEFE
jgi:hypothetical protein